MAKEIEQSYIFKVEYYQHYSDIYDTVFRKPMIVIRKANGGELPIFTGFENYITGKDSRDLDTKLNIVSCFLNELLIDNDNEISDLNAKNVINKVQNKSEIETKVIAEFLDAYHEARK